MIFLVSPPTLSAESKPQAPSEVAGTAEAEIDRRGRLLADATALIEEGDLLAGEGSLEAAMSSFSEAAQILPRSPVTDSVRTHAIKRFSETAVQHARTLVEGGHAGEAGRLLEAVLVKEMNPGYAPAAELLSDLADPQIVNPGRTPEHVRDVSEVESLLFMAGDLADTGQYDLAEDAYQQVLRIDRYNSAARRGMVRVDRLKNDYLQSAQTHTRAKALGAVDAAWEQNIPASSNLINLFGVAEDSGRQGTVAVSEKLKRIVLPKVQLVDATVREVAEFLSFQSRQYDTTSLESNGKGVSIVVAGGPEYAEAKVTLDVKGLPLGEVLRYVADQAGMRYVAERYAVRLVPLTTITEGLMTRVFRVPPDFIQSDSQGGDAGAGVVDPFAPLQTAGGGAGQLHKRLSAREFLEKQGIAFPKGAAADFNPQSSTLMVRNTQDAVDLVETLVDQARSQQPRQVEVIVHMLEVRQDTLGELGYDWLLSPFNVGSSDRIFGSGGVSGNSSTALAGSDYPFNLPDGSIIGGLPLTAGLRGASDLRSIQSIDNLLGTRSASGLGSESPGILAVSGVFNDPQFQTVLRALDQATGTDLMTAPRTIAKSGQRAKIEVVQEFIYPTEFDPPEIPESVGIATNFPGPGDDDSEDQSTGDGTAPILPATPTSFEARNLGVTLEVEPIISEDNRSVDLNISPEFVEFLGFVDYGSDITQVSFGNLGARLLTQNDILQPIFRKIGLSTSVTVWDGQTVVIGGILRDEAKQINDEVPFLGAIPGIGHFFRSQASELVKRNLVIFVTVKIIDPGGNRLHAPVALEGRQ